jgi:hypothetical protein
VAAVRGAVPTLAAREAAAGAAEGKAEVEVFGKAEAFPAEVRDRVAAEQAVEGVREAVPAHFPLVSPGAVLGEAAMAVLARRLVGLKEAEGQAIPQDLAAVDRAAAQVQADLAPGEVAPEWAAQVGVDLGPAEEFPEVDWALAEDPAAGEEVSVPVVVGPERADQVGVDLGPAEDRAVEEVLVPVVVAQEWVDQVGVDLGRVEDWAAAQAQEEEQGSEGFLEAKGARPESG